MSLGKAMIHARKQKSIARVTACAADHGPGQYGVQANHMLQMPVLVLNASYEPINICGARRALVLVLKGIARTEEEHGLTFHAQRSRIPMPSVIRLLEYRRIPHQTRALSRKNILLRDRNSCQYCGVVLPSGELTLDTSFPAPAAATPPGKTSWPAATAATAARATACCTSSMTWCCCAIPAPSPSTPAARSCACWAAATTAGASTSTTEPSAAKSKLLRLPRILLIAQASRFSPLRPEQRPRPRGFTARFQNR